MFIHESTRLIAENHEQLWTGHAIEDCPHRYYHPSRIHCFLLALKFKQPFLPMNSVTLDVNFIFYFLFGEKELTMTLLILDRF